MTHLKSQTDVVVVGAGTAGLAAAKALQKEGVEVVVLEAAGHAGGRCVTDNSTFTVPFDRGGSWLHSAEINPLARLAEEGNRTLHKRAWERTKAHVLGHDLSPGEVADYSQFETRMWDSICEHGARDKDCSIKSAIPDGTWSKTTALLVPLWLAGDADETSAQDISNYADTPSDWLVEGGLGSFVADLHSDVPVHLNCPVEKIDYSGRGVSVSTPQGTVNARNVIVTVSTGVLQRESIEFHPQLPVNKLAAIGNLPIGLLNKVGIEFDKDWSAAASGEFIDYHGGENALCILLFGFYGSGLAVGFVGGRFADELEAQGDQAATHFCLEALQSTFGNDVTKYIKRTDETAWRADANTLGSFSFARPGAAHARKVLAEPLLDRIFFAGEATMPDCFATVHGAYLSGLRAAGEILAINAKSMKQTQ